MPTKRSLIAAALLLFWTVAQAAEPIVKGPESVADWNNAGMAFIASGKSLQDNTRQAKNGQQIVLVN